MEQLTISTWFFSPGQLRFNGCNKEEFIRKPTAPRLPEMKNISINLTSTLAVAMGLVFN
jgi:hypothetical protein